MAIVKKTRRELKISRAAFDARVQEKTECEVTNQQFQLKCQELEQQTRERFAISLRLEEKEAELDAISLRLEEKEAEMKAKLSEIEAKQLDLELRLKQKNEEVELLTHNTSLCEAREELELGVPIGLGKRGVGGSMMPEEKLTLFRMLVAGTPTSAMIPVIHAMLHHQNSDLKKPLPTTEYYQVLRRALYPLNFIFSAVLLGVAQNVGCNMDGKSIAGFEVLAVIFTVVLPQDVLAKFNGGFLTTVDSTAAGGAETVARYYQKLQRYLKLVQEEMVREGMDVNSPSSYWTAHNTDKGVPTRPQLTQLQLVVSDSCHTMTKQVAELKNKMKCLDDVDVLGIENEPEIMGDGPTSGAINGATNDDDLDRILEESINEAFSVLHESNVNVPDRDHDDIEEQDPSGLEDLKRIGCTEHYASNGIQKGVDALVQAHIELMEEENGKPLNMYQRKIADPILLFRQYHLLTDAKATYYLNFFHKVMLPWLIELFPDVPWLSMPRDVGSRFWVLIFASFAFLYCLSRMLLFLGERREAGLGNKLESNVWNGSINADVVNAVMVIALVCDQVAYPCLLAFSAKVIDVREMGKFCDTLMDVLTNPPCIMNRKCTLENVTPSLCAAAENRRNKEFNIIKDRGNKHGTKKKIDVTELVTFRDEKSRDRAMKLLRAFCGAMHADLNETLKPYLSSADGPLSEGKEIPDLVLHMGTTNTPAERSLSKLTLTDKNLQNANLEASAGLSSMQLNRFFELGLPLTPKEAKKRESDSEKNFSVGLLEKFNPAFVRVCVVVAIQNVENERSDTKKNQSSQARRAKQNMVDGKKKKHQRDLKEAHLKAISMARIKNGALIRSLEDLDSAFRRCYKEYPRKSQLEATHDLCKTQIVLHSAGLGYEEARKINYTKNGKNLDLRKKVQDLVKLGIERDFEENADSDEEEVALPGARCPDAQRMEKIRHEKIKKLEKGAVEGAMEKLEIEWMTAAEKETKAHAKNLKKLEKYENGRMAAAEKESKKYAKALKKMAKEENSRKAKADRESKAIARSLKKKNRR